MAIQYLYRGDGNGWSSSRAHSFGSGGSGWLVVGSVVSGSVDVSMNAHNKCQARAEQFQRMVKFIEVKTMDNRQHVNQAKSGGGDNPQEFWTLDKVCAWCWPGSKGNSIGSHSICPMHADKLMEEVRAMSLKQLADTID